MDKLDKTIQKKYKTYVDGVTSGKIITGKLVRLAVERHLRDLDSGKDRGLLFDEPAGNHVCQFFEKYLKHSKGEWAGKPFILEPWQVFELYSLFGWKNDQGLRRFKKAYRELARKNGKSTAEAGKGCYLLFGDEEIGAEIYTAATKLDQAKIVHDEAVNMVKKSKGLMKFAKIFHNSIVCERTSSKYMPLGADSNTMDGLNPHGVIIDELHAHRTRKMWDVLNTALGSRRQPLLLAITTAGFDRHSVCWEQHDYSEKILNGIIDDDSWFGLIYSIDEADDWHDDKIWIKANPNLGIAKKWDYMRSEFKEACEKVSYVNTFRRLHLDEWTEQSVKWIDMTQWDACHEKIYLEELKGRQCFGGLDLSSTLDITAFVLIFPKQGEDDKIIVLSWFWLPEENMRKRVERDRVPYDIWKSKGFITTTPGNVIDYDFIRKQIREIGETYEIIEMGYDPYNATQLVLQLQDDGFLVVPVRQGFLSMTAPTKELEKIVVGQELNHLNNPVLRWMANNVMTKTDPAGNLKPDKEKSIEKIDGVVALINGIDRMMRKPGQRKSVYEDRGVLTF